MTPLASFLLLMGVMCAAHWAEAILAGEDKDWQRNGYLVKILSRENADSDVKTCTGTLISASLVLTSAQCVYNRTSEKTMRQFVVFVLRPNEEDTLRSTAKLLQKSATGHTAGWALLRISPQNITELCPPSPAPKWVSRLNFKPSLIANPHLIVDPVQLPGGCRLLGFATSEKAKDFITEKSVFSVFLEQIFPPASSDANSGFVHHRSSIHDDFTGCYDDAGAPLVCKPDPQVEDEFQLGLFHSLTAGEQVDGNEAQDPIDKCRRATEMRFTLFHNDTSLARAIQRYGMAEFVKLYQECDFE